MTSAKKKKPQTPPKPWEQLTQSAVAGLADCSVDTVARARNAGKPPIGTLPWKQVGKAWKAPADAVYKALDLDIASPWVPDEKEKQEVIKRLRDQLDKLTGAAAAKRSLQPGLGLAALLGLKNGPSPARKRGGKVPLKAIQAILDQLRALGAPARLSINGKLMTFANMGDFLARAQPNDEWLFITPSNGRPMDLESALYLGCWEGKLELLTLDDYIARLKHGLAHEAALKEREILEGAVKQSKSTKKSKPRGLD
jgi:hypothetical protein